MRNIIIVSITLVIILAITVMSLNTLEVISEQRDIKVLPNDYNPYQALYDEMLYPTVRITTTQGIGSGVVIQCSKVQELKGLKEFIYVLTAAHVVGNNTSVTVTIYSENIITSLPASVVITDTSKDLALLRIPKAFGTDLQDIIHKAKLVNKDYKPYLFTPVYAVGCSLGLNPRPSFGHLCALGELGGEWEISSPILPGNSGGPIYDANTHEVIGIAVWVKVYHGQLVTTMAGIVPIQTVYQFLDEFHHKDTKDTKTGYNSYILGDLCASVVNLYQFCRFCDVSSNNAHLEGARPADRTDDFGKRASQSPVTYRLRR